MLKRINTRWRVKVSSLASRLFYYFAIILLLILGLQNLAEQALVKALLQVPENVQQDMRELARQADNLLNLEDREALAKWEQEQSYYLFVLDENQQVLSGREMHPHFKFKLKYIRRIDTILEARVNQPIIALPLSHGYRLVVQFPHTKHPARTFRYYSGISKVVIAILLLSVFSFLLARYLQKPLGQLQHASRQLAQGDFRFRVADAVGTKVSEFSELAQDFDHMAYRIEALAEKQRRLIRDVSHELRTPLARQNLALHLVRKKMPVEHAALTDKLERESDVMNELIDEILQFSRLENATYAPRLAPVQLDALCSYQVIESEQIKGADQTLECDISRQLPLAVADRRLVSRVLSNLVGNAIKYAGPQATIRLSAYQTGKRVCLQVEDNGKGIPEQYLNKIFDPFTRIEQARDKQSGGYGLGLSIVKESMRVMGGDVTIENRQSGGLRVNLIFNIH